MVEHLETGNTVNHGTPFSLSPKLDAMLTPSSLRCFGQEDDLALSSSLSGTLNSLSPFDLSGDALRYPTGNAREQVLSEDQEPSSKTLSKSQSVACVNSADSPSRLEYWRAATAKTKRQNPRNACPSGIRPFKAKSGIPAVNRTCSLRHRLSGDAETFAACCDLPQARAELKEERSLSHSGRVMAEVSFHSCDSIIISSISRSASDVENSQQVADEQQRLQLQHRLISYPSFGASSETSDSAGGTPPAYRAATVIGGGLQGPSFSPAASLGYSQSKICCNPGEYPSPSYGGNAWCQSERVQPERVSRLISQNSIDFQKEPLERYHSLQAGDVVKVVSKQRNHSYGGPNAASMLKPKANVFEWAARTRMDSKVDLSRRSSV